MIRITNIDRRLMPLYIATFFEAMVFFYAVEKLFMRQIGFNDTQIGIAIGALAIASLIVEIPSGILSDKWSRKGTQALAYAALLLCVIIGYFSNDIATYTAAAVAWGAYIALTSGVIESIVYDVLLEENDSSNGYEKYYGRLEIIASIGLIISSLLSSLIASMFDERATYAATIPMIIIALFVVLKFKEPLIHKTHQESDLVKHVKQTFKEVLHRKEMYLLLLCVVSVGMVERTVFEFGQIWWITLGVSAVLFGPFNAVLVSAIGIAGHFGQYLKSRKIMMSVGLAMVIFTATLTIQSAPIAIVSQVVALTSALSLIIVLNKRIQDNLSSAVRSGASSVVGTLTAVVSIPFIFAFGWLSENHSIFTASYMVIAASALSFAMIMLIVRQHQRSNI